MPRPRIQGSAGSDPQATTPAEPVEPPAPTARLIEEGGVFYVEVGGRRLPLAADDVARLRAASPAPRGALSELPPGLASAIESARANRDTLLRIPHVIAVRGGFKFVGGRITPVPAVVVAVDRKLDDLPASERVPDVLPDGMPTDVTVADPLERAAAGGTEFAAEGPPLLIDQLQVEAQESGVLEAVPVITYEPPPGASLDPVTGPMVVTCHVSPDAGWSVLRDFLEQTEREVTLGMYDFTAPHIYRTVRSLLRDSDVRWQQTLGPHESLPAPDDVDSTKAEDKTEASIIRGLDRVAASRFENAFAHVGTGQTFASAYHIKVAVRDGSATWLSSGNWQSSNQPAIDLLSPNADRRLIARYNREWHLVVESSELAETFQRYLRHDFETAHAAPEEAAEEAAAAGGPDLVLPVDELLEAEREAVGVEVFPSARLVFSAAEPLTVQPILTPDNYTDVVLRLLRERPEQRLYFQNQSLNPVREPTPAWGELLERLVEYANDDDLDVRIIFRNIGPIRKKLESLQAAGFPMAKVRVQAGCHTKGIVIDSSTVLVGSHNWTNQGVEVNRDASLLIVNPEIAGYFERVFLHDWEHLARPTIREDAMPIPGGSEEAGAVGAEGLRRVPWSEWLEE
jgi:hypothetical protein